MVVIQPSGEAGEHLLAICTAVQQLKAVTKSSQKQKQIYNALILTTTDQAAPQASSPEHFSL